MAQFSNHSRMRSLQGNSEMKSGVQNADWELTSKKERERKQHWAKGEVELGWKPDKTLEQMLLTQVLWDWVEWLDLYTSTLLSHQYKMLWEGHDLERGGCLHLRGADSWRPSATALSLCSWAASPSVTRDLGSSVSPRLPH